MENSVISEFVRMSKQDKRLANKKRKAEVLLNLLSQSKKNKRKQNTEVKSSDESDDESGVSPAKKSKQTEDTEGTKISALDEKTLLKIEKKKQKKQRLKEIRMQIKKIQKLESNPKERPAFHLTLQELLDQQLRNRSEVERGADELPTLYMLDVQHLLTLSLLPDSYTHYPRWCKLARPSKVTSVVVIVLDQLGASDLEEYQHCFPFMKETFKEFAEVVSPYQYKSSVMKDIFQVPYSNTALKSKAVRNNREKVKQEKKDKLTNDGSAERGDTPTDPDFNRKHLLLNPLQLMHEGYPMPVKTVKDRYKDFQFSFKSYKAVTENSPMFAVDCEMCMTTSGESELTRISVVNERLETVYDTLVRPYNRITNYLTQYSGITKKMLEPVKTRLKEVHRKLRQLLPSDSIWLGQSLNNDLSALKLFHPYVIDTSVIYNLSGFKWKKTGLKILAAQFLKQDIQCGAEGHSSVEDARATMELVQLKLRKGMLFGDATMSALEEDSEGEDEDTTNKPVKSEKKEEKEANSLSENTAVSGNSAVDAKDKLSTETGSAVSSEKPGACDTVDSKSVNDDNETEIDPAVGSGVDVPVSKTSEKRKLFFHQQQGHYQHLLTMAHRGNKSAVVIDKSDPVTELCVGGGTFVGSNSDKSRTQEAVSAVQTADFVWVQLHGLGNINTHTGEESGTACKGEEEGMAECDGDNSGSEDGEIKDDPEKLKCLKRMDKRVRRIVKRVRSKSLVCVVLTGLTNQQSLHNAGVLIKIT